MLKQDEDTAFAANHVANNPKSIELILSGAKIDVVQQPVVAGEVKVVFVSLYSLLSMLKQDEDTAFAANHVANNPKSIELILSGAKIDVVQQPVVAGEEYKNPWSDRTDAEATVFDHDTIINHVVSIEVGRFGEKALDKLMDKMLQE